MSLVLTQTHIWSKDGTLQEKDMDMIGHGYSL